jgi:hypothetical protein
LADCSGSLEPFSDLAVPGDGNEMHTIEGTRLADVIHHLTREVDSGVAVRVERLNERFGYGEFSDV